MRIGRLRKEPAATGGALTPARVAEYLRLRVGTVVTDERQSAVAWMEKASGLALDRVTWDIDFVGSTGGEKVLLPDWFGIEPLDDTYVVDPITPVVVFPERNAPTDGTFQFTAGYGSADLPVDLRTATLYMAAVFHRFRGAGIPPGFALPDTVLGIVDSHKRFINTVAPVIVSFDAATGSIILPWE